MPSTSSHSQESGFSSSLEKPGNPHGMKGGHAEGAPQGCGGTFGVCPSSSEAGDTGTPGDRVPGSRLHLPGRGSSRIFSVKLLPTSTRGLCCTRKGNERSSIHSPLPVRSWLSPTSQPGLSRTQTPRITPKGDIYMLGTAFFVTKASVLWVSCISGRPELSPTFPGDSGTKADPKAGTQPSTPTCTTSWAAPLERHRAVPAVPARSRRALKRI